MKKSKTAKPRVPRNYFMVNLSAWDRAQLEKLCRANRTCLKTEMRRAVLGIQQELSERNGLDFDRLYVPLAAGDFRALKYFAPLFTAETKLPTVAQFILRLALCRPAMVKAMMDTLLVYCRSEGVNQSKYLADCVATRREYRRVKVLSQ